MTDNGGHNGTGTSVDDFYGDGSSPPPRDSGRGVGVEEYRDSKSQLGGTHNMGDDKEEHGGGANGDDGNYDYDEEDSDEKGQEDSYNDEDESEEGYEIEGRSETPDKFERIEYEALAEKKRKALSQCDDSEKRAKYDANNVPGMEGIMEFMVYGGRRKSRKHKRRGRRKGSKKKVPPEITKIYTEALFHYGHGRFSEALSCLQRVIHQAPGFADAYDTLALVSEALGETKLAMEGFKLHAAVRRDSYSCKVLFEWFKEQGDMSSARTYASKAIQADPEDISLKFEYATLCLNAGKVREAAESYEQIFRQCPNSVDALKWAAKYYLECGEGERAASVLEVHIKSNPSEVSHDVIDLLAAVFMKINAYDRALKFMEDMRQTYHPRKELTSNLKIREVICHVHLKELKMAENLLNILPQKAVYEHTDLISELADEFINVGDFHSALKYYHLLESNAGFVNDGYLLLKIARCYKSLAERTQAIGFFYKALNVLNDIAARLTLASLLLEDDKRDEAIFVLSPPVNPDPNDDKQKAWWRNRQIRMRLCQIYHSEGMLENFVETALQLVLDWVRWKVKGKRKRSVDSLSERAKQERNRRRRLQRDDPTVLLRGCGPKKMRKIRATLNEAKRIRDRVAITAQKEDNSGESEEEAIRDDEYHHLLVDLCKALTSLQKYWEALEIVNLARRLDAKMLPVDKKKELQSLGAQISCDTLDPKQWFDCVRCVIQQHPHRLDAWNCYFRVISRLGRRISTEAKFMHHLRSKHRDCVPPILIAGHHFTVTSRHQDAAREYLEAYKLLPENPLINLCVGTSLINLALGFRLQNKHQCLAQGFAFLYNNLRICNNSQEALYNIARAYHHVGLVTLAAPYYEKVLEIHEKEYPTPKLPNEDPNVAEERKLVNCDLRREAAHNLHLIYKNSGAFDLARQVLKDHCTF
ncbi:PREDICTED: general transcription factor 3C polypeptide 3 [Tarenaya hassleriana]|uniref:general transcription factor 3C polypeptide 3 n=1 Tax=Tarenaya hassleriana TaxID=28532 RepID=UPI00053C61D1|nr:PREDICTED: general transcription factor 3C polypeptide 3 [Tarenaya hassleriana]